MPDVVSVPEAAGREALARLLGYGQPAVAPGPVALSAGGRVLFYVAAGGAEDLPELLEWLDWGGVRLDLSAVPAEQLTDPPVRWLHPSTVPMQRPGGAGPGTAATATAITAAAIAAPAEDTDAVRNGDSAALRPGKVGKAEDVEGSDDALRAGNAPRADGTARRHSYPTPGLPEAPELIALLATLAAACHRLAVAAAR
ncbi:hypothetical protein [Catenulispora rubra]|uniref:hypothetical protein n=1 Tax=Catenulispora rubra TaxID=280293 RepID=UPI00189269FC|nr:hypothetical protein [Catenulispora rubra]